MRLSMIALLLATGCTPMVTTTSGTMTGPPPPGSALLRLCNGVGTGLRFRVNWKTPVPIAAGRCGVVAVRPGLTLVRVRPVGRPFDWVRSPALRLELGRAGAEVRYAERDGFLQPTRVRGARWARCNYVQGWGVKAPPWRGTVEFRRDEVERWIRTFLHCKPGA